MSSSWRDYFWKVPYEKKHEDQKQLVDLFNKYNIEVIDITPHCTDGKRDKEIQTWIEEHKSEVNNFVIFDDENTLLGDMANDIRFIQTSSAPIGNMIIGHWNKNVGLNRKHVKKAIRILNQ